MDSASVGPARGCTFVNSAVIATSLPMEVKILLDRRFREQTEESQKEVELQDGSKSELPRTLNVLCRESVESEAASNYVTSPREAQIYIQPCRTLICRTSTNRCNFTIRRELHRVRSALRSNGRGARVRSSGEGRNMKRDDERYHTVTRTIRGLSHRCVAETHVMEHQVEVKG
jgi:hypothetical protein